jgi:membrane associated rhomboid family serine protease
MFLIPTGTDRDGGRRTWAVWAMVFACIAVHILGRAVRQPSEDESYAVITRLLSQYEGAGRATGEDPEVLRASLESELGPGATSGPPIGSIASFLGSPNTLTYTYTFGISRAAFEWWQPFTSIFLHERGWSLHLFMNMVFLVAFGSVIESRLGHLGFLAVFLAGGALSGLTQAFVGSWMDPASALGPAIGASGSVSALMGLAFALHPRANVRGIAIPQFTTGYTSMRWMMAFAVALDIARTIVDWSGEGNSGIATLAHLGGTLSGFLLGLGLLASGLLARNDFDALYLLKQRWRRREMRLALEQAGVGTPGGAVAARVRAGGASVETESQRTLRNTIAAAHRERDYTLAAQLYTELLRSLPDATLPAGIQLDVANQLAHEGRHGEAVAAYTRFLERFRTHVSSDDVRVMLAALQIRRLGDGRAGLATLDGFAGRELDRDRQALVDTLRAEARS